MKEILISLTKSLLDKFFKKSDKSYLSRQFLPTATYTDVLSQIETDKQMKIIAPFDGWFIIGASCNGTPEKTQCSVCVWQEYNAGLDCSAYSEQYFTQAKAYIPCTKGAEINYLLQGYPHMGRFYPLVGQTS